MTTYAETVIDYDASVADKVGKELKSKITFDGINYNTSLYYTPVSKDSKEYNHIVSKISTRKQYNKAQNKFVTCLESTASYVKGILDESIVSLYLFVNEQGKATSDQASGTLQVVNNSTDVTRPSQAWICDLCRHAPDKTKKSAKSPVAPIMHLFEQIAYYVFKKSEIYLMVEKIPKSTEEPFLVGFYRDNYGFVVDDAFRVMNDNANKKIVMKKTIVPDPKFADFPFAELPKKKSRTKKKLLIDESSSNNKILGKKRGVESIYSAEMGMGATFGGSLRRRQRKTRKQHK
jgi:hypothetical protein